MDVRLTPEEKETVIRGNAGSKTWEVVTADPSMIRYMEKQGYTPDDRKNPWGYKSYTLDRRPSIPKKNRAPRSKAQVEASARNQNNLKSGPRLQDSGDQKLKDVSIIVGSEINSDL